MVIYVAPVVTSIMGLFSCIVVPCLQECLSARLKPSPSIIFTSLFLNEPLPLHYRVQSCNIIIYKAAINDFKILIKLNPGIKNAGM